MAGKKVLVTGSGTGIGRSIAEEFSKAGAEVAIHYAHDEEGAGSLVSEIVAAGGKAQAFRADFTNLDQVLQLAASAEEFLGGLDVLVNNSGITMNMPFEKVRPDHFDTLYQVNVRSPFFLTQAVVEGMATRGSGVIINISSIHYLQGMPQHAVYAGTKGAISASTRALAIELAPKGIRVNAIAPGAVVVENYYKAMPDFNAHAAGRLIPAGFIGQPRDIAGACLFLASEEARFIVGQTLVIDGGTTAWMAFSDSFRQPLTAQFGKGYVPGI